MPALYNTAFSTSLGWMRPVSDGTSLIRLDWEQSSAEQSPWNDDDQIDNVSRETKMQILQYLAGKRRDFDLPLAPEGKTESGRDWLSAMARIPY